MCSIITAFFQVNNKRIWAPEPGEEAMDSGFKKQKSITEISRKVESSNNCTNDDSNIGNESDSDADYDDLDDIALPSDNDDFLDEDGDPDEDDKSVHSTATTVSDSSACSNTPSLIGESLETSTISTQDNTAPRKHAWVNMQTLNNMQPEFVWPRKYLLLALSFPSLHQSQSLLFFADLT